MRYTESRGKKDSIKYNNLVITVIAVRKEYIIISFKKRKRIEAELDFILFNCRYCINL